MLEGIRRLVRKQTEDGDWDGDLPMEIEVGAGSESQAINLIQRPESALSPYPSTAVTTGREYYAGLARAAIAEGGRSGNYAISVYWLRMMLAGLEGKDEASMAIWEGRDLWGLPPQ